MKEKNQAKSSDSSKETLCEEHLLPGLKPVLEHLDHAPEKIDLVLCKTGLQTTEVQKIQSLCHKHAIRFRRVPADVLDKVCRREKAFGGSARHQGVLARLTETSVCSLDDLAASAEAAPLPLILALDQVKDPGNLGTLARTFFILGGAGLLLPTHNSASLGPQARRTAAGALENLPISRVTNLAHALDTLEEKGFMIYGSVRPTSKTENIFTVCPELPAVLVLGNEERGIRPEVLKRCSRLLTIPQARPFDSFNVAQAGAILLAFISANYSR
ncbi:MAG: RNA methyltransferase [Desulfovibrio sp.]|nr:RNA methyltransferase [Desulfovibrio sp.]